MTKHEKNLLKKIEVVLKDAFRTAFLVSRVVENEVTNENVAQV